MAISVDVMDNEFLRDIFIKGKQTGRQEGRQEGEAKLLLRQLSRRFGLLPAWVAEKVNQSGQSDLERWGDQIFDAQSLEDVFSEVD
ncbi:MAG: DUF4351 domain-containing protein [Magnetococcales bacterium]|nr:DUF4351 domain-containing protein [Magnetococcales bacterium]